MTGRWASGRMGQQEGSGGGSFYAGPGERNAVEGVLRWIHPLVVRYCRARAGDQEKTFASADDVAQEVRLVVLTTWLSYRAQGWPVHDVAPGIAAHKVADAHRSAAQVMQVELTERRTKLPDKQRDILVLRVVVGLAAAVTAEVVGSTPGAVRDG